MAQLKPSAEFSKYAQDLVDDEVSRPLPYPTDVMENRLWAAAQFDGYIQNGQLRCCLTGWACRLQWPVAINRSSRRPLRVTKNHAYPVVTQRNG